MKTLINIIIVGLFGVEVCSPFLIGYFNHREKRSRTSQEFYCKRQNIERIYQKVIASGENPDWKKIDYSETSYSDSKALKIKE